MTKNTTKKKKRKNMKMRRTVRKTIAAIFMIMAVVVAAIPVEQLGTMQAATTTARTLKIADVFQSVYDDSATNSKMESALINYKPATSDVINYNYDKAKDTVQDYTVKIDYNSAEGKATYLKEFAIRDRSNNNGSVLLGYVGGDKSAAIDLTKKRYTSYFIINQDYTQAVKGVLAKESYTITFTDDTTTQTTVYAKDGTKQTVPYRLSVDIVNSSDIENSGSINVNNETYRYVDGKDTAETVIKTYAKSSYDTRLKDIQAYNDKINSIINNTGNSEPAELQTAIAEVAKLHGELQTLTVSYSKDTSNKIVAVDSQETFLKYSIINRFYADDNSFPLTGFTLLDLTDKVNTNTSTNEKEYVPIWTSETIPDYALTHITDDNLISFSDEVIITGIGNDAFRKDGTNSTDLEITSLKLSDNVEFIGKNAFTNQTSLKTVDLAYCKVIANDAFYDCTNLESVKFGSESGNQSTGVLGARAFYNCQKLTDITFPKELKIIGTACFANSGLTKFGMSSTSTAGETGSSTLTIWPFAFYNCAYLSGDTSSYFNSSVEIIIGLGAFAVGDGSNKLTKFIFPTKYTKFIHSTNDEFGIAAALTKAGVPGAKNSSNTAGEVYYDYILAGRNALRTVTFSGSLYSCKIPDNTLMGCSNLDYVIFGEASYKEDDKHCQSVFFDSPDIAGDTYEYDTDKDGEYLFQDITNKNFYVKGPGFETNGETPTKLRIHTKAAKTAVSEFVPYVYLNESGQEQIEATYDGYVATVVVNPDRTVTLKSYDFISNHPSTIRNLEVPSTIAGYQVTQLGSDCFSGVKDHIIELTIQDGSVKTIDAKALEGADSLARVNIGNSVLSVGSGAFSDCKLLENVYFSEPISDGSEMKIASDAFKTNSKYLTFHGKIEEGYAPYEYAMNVDTAHFTSQAANRNICYQTDTPTQFKVLLDNATYKSTLVDYPHFEEIDLMNDELCDTLGIENNISQYSIIKNFNVNQGWEKDANYNKPLTQEENDIIMSALMVDIPKGIESLDARSYFLVSDNSVNKDYLTLDYNETDNGITPKTGLSRKMNAGASGQNDPVKLYSDDEYPNKIGTTAAAGLFSGNFLESDMEFFKEGNTFNYSLNENFNNQEYKEKVTAGNDILTSVGLGSITNLPDYAFYSCENLLSVKIGSALTTMGKIPFRGCTKLTGIESESGSPFFSNNAVIYQQSSAVTRAASGLTLVEVLESRGDSESPQLYQKAAISTTNDPQLVNVTSIADEAFAYTDVTYVDLSDSQVTAIPEGCFSGASKLKTVILPETATSIGQDAFAGTNPDVYINNPSCTITDAFDQNYNGTIYGYKYTDDTNTVESPAYKYAQSLKNATFAEIGYIVTFESDGKVYEVQNVNSGKAATKPTDPTKTGYKFKEWQWTKSDGTVLTGSDAYSNVTENRKVVAVFEPGNGVVSDGNTYTMTVSGGTGNGSTSLTDMTGGSIVVLEATDVSTTQSFQYWSISGTDIDGNEVDCTELISDIHSASTSMYMPNANVTVTAHYTTNSTDSNSGNNSNSNSNNSNSNSSSTDTTTKYKLTVNYGSGSGEYVAGEVVTISAYAPDSSSKVFSKWTTTSTGVGFVSATAASTTITMPASEVTVTANYKTRTSDDDSEDDSEAAARRRGTSTTTTTTTVANGTNNAQNTTTTSATGTATATTTPATAQGDRLSIDKSGISNKDVGSTTVEGATDNFVVKISDSDSAVSEAQAALLNKFGSLDGIVYFPMDISLYDATGKNKITDTTGLNVTVTVPIPDEMIQYGGNVHMAAIENSQLQDLNVKFTTIDGIACMSFVAPHFSPYVAYVDTQNLVAGQMLDATPKTGDPIHPKWFLAAGMACLSIILFASGDKKRRIKIA